MTYNVEKAVEDYGGKEKVLQYIYTEGPNQIMLHQELKLSKSSNRMSAPVYKRLYKYLGIEELPYPKILPEIKKFYLALDRSMPEYWKDQYVVELLTTRLTNPTINMAEDRVRAVINFPRHPMSNATSGQLKGHIVAWELYNEQYVPENHWVIPLDNNYLNLEKDNLILVNITEYKSKKFSGEGNPSYLHGNALRPKLGGWDLISRTKRLSDGKCKVCGCTEDLVVHHIISYHLFNNPIDAHQLLNLITLCRSCHTNLHNHTLSIVKDLIAEMRYSKLIELLETLKSQVPDTLMETYKDVEKQLGLTDNQQPSI